MRRIAFDNALRLFGARSHPSANIAEPIAAKATPKLTRFICILTTNKKRKTPQHLECEGFLCAKLANDF